jgi:hypothetical protein
LGQIGSGSMQDSKIKNFLVLEELS